VTFDPTLRVQALQDWPWRFPHKAVPEDYFRGAFTDKHPLNIPGPFYGAATDTCCGGPEYAPRSVLFDHEGMEFVWRQPRDDSEVHELMQAAYDDPFSGFGRDGDRHWTPALVREWWCGQDDKRPLMQATQATLSAPPETGTARGNARFSVWLADWFDYLKGPAIAIDLRCYIYRLEVGRYPGPADKLPAL
jgi:hypothetical protein